MQQLLQQLGILRPAHQHPQELSLAPGLQHRVVLVGLLFSHLWTNGSEITEVLHAIQASYHALGSHTVDLWTALMLTILNRNPALSPRLNLQ